MIVCDSAARVAVSMMQPIVSGYMGAQSPVDGGRAGVLSPPTQMSPQPVSSSGGTSASPMACGGAYSTDRSTRVTHMANGALMTRTLHMAPTTTSVRGLHSGHGRRHAVMNPYPHAHLRGATLETSSSSTSGGARRVQTGQHLVSVFSSPLPGHSSAP